MTSAPPPPPTSEPEDGFGPRVTSQQMRDVTRLRRTVHGERKIAGVAGGLARQFDVDPLVVRVAFVVLALFGGSGILLYGALWLILPEDGADSAIIRLDERSLTVALVGVGVLAGLALLGTWSDARWISWPIAVVAVVVLLVASTRERRPTPYRSGRHPAPGAPAGAPPPPAAAGSPAARAAAGTTPAGEPMTSPTVTTESPPTASGETAQQPPAPPAPPAGPTWDAPPPLPPLRDPRRRGPLLVWATMALMALGVGILGMVDVAGADVPVSAYPAVATAIAGVMLLVGAFYGRAGGIIFLGLVSATAMAATAIGERIETDQYLLTPTSSAEVVDTYSQTAGEMVYDLTEVRDIAALDGRRITLEQGAGRIEVVVPDDIDVVTTTSIGAGSAQIFGSSRDGVGIDFTQRHDVVDESATVHLDVQVGLGEVVVHVDDTLPAPTEETR
jgi:phage shock protein PspC (stress-responsive transcriptional regulator)